MATVKVEKINGVEVTFEVDSNGRFSADFDGGSHRGDTLAEVREKAQATIRKAKRAKAVEVTIVKHHARAATDTSRFYGDPFVDGIGSIDVTLRGYAERTRELLITHAGKKLGINASSYDKVICRRLTAAEDKRYHELHLAVSNAEVALEQFLAPLRVDPRTVTDPKGEAEDES